MSMNQATRSGGGLVWLITIPLWGFLGFIGDLPPFVGRGESILARLGQWTSTIAWTLFTVVMVFVAPVVGAFAGIVTAAILARRLAARRGVPMTTSEIFGPIDRYILIAGLASPFAAMVVPNVSIIAALATLVLVGAAGHVGWKRGNNQRLHDRDYRLHSGFIHAVLGKEKEDETLLIAHDKATDSITIEPLPHSLRVALDDANTLDARVAAIDPRYEAEFDDSHTWMLLKPTTPERAAKREALRQSGGLIAGLGTVPSALPSVPLGDTAPVPSAAPLKINLEDL